MRTASVDGEQMPLSWDVLEAVDAPILESDSRAGHQVLDGVGDQDLARDRSGGHPRANINCQAAQLIADDVAFTGVHPGPNLYSQPKRLVAHSACRADRAGGPIKGCDHSPVGRFNLAAPEPRQVLPDE